jgi:hypothetical protein
MSTRITKQHYAAGTTVTAKRQATDLSSLNKSGEMRVLNALVAISFGVRLLQTQLLSHFKKHKPIFADLVSYGCYIAYAQVFTLYFVTFTK